MTKETKELNLKIKCKRNGTVRIYVDFMIGKKNENNNITTFSFQKKCYLVNNYDKDSSNHYNYFKFIHIINLQFVIVCILIFIMLYHTLNERYDENVPL